MPKALEFRGPHAEFLADQSSEIDFEGSRYSGKTWACCAKVIESCLKYPGIKWNIARYSDTETRTKLGPEFYDIARKYYGVDLPWNDKSNNFQFPTIGEHTSRVYAYGLRAQTKLQELEKVRGMDTCGLWVDQAEEIPQAICEEFPFSTRMPGYPHQIILSPNPPPEDHYLADMYPVEGSPFKHRRYYRVSLYDNAHNLSPGKIAEIEAMYPVTHAKYRSLVLGLRGPNVTGKPVYDDVFDRAKHVGSVDYDPTRPILESIHQGQQHPVWLCGQSTYWGGFRLLGGVMGKRLFLDDFLEIVARYRAQWFDAGLGPQFKTCCDPPPEIGSGRFSNATALRRAGFTPTWTTSGSAPDVREAVIQDLAAMMHVANAREGLRINADDTKWIMASRAVEKHTKLLIDGCEASYVWDEHLVSVGSKKVRQPKVDEWVDGWQRCLENIHLNFIAGRKTDFERDRERERDARDDRDNAPYVRPSLWT